MRLHCRDFCVYSINFLSKLYKTNIVLFGLVAHKVDEFIKLGDNCVNLWI
jgi:hypothetical protein